MKPVSNVPKVMDGEVKLIAINTLKPFSKHTFTLYQGERLDDMVESIKKNGVIVPIIARNIENSDKFEIISGHNRVYASGLAGLERVPAVVKVGISDEEALVWMVDSNLLQRGFHDLKISEQAFAVAMRYKKLFDAKKLAAIDEELRSLEGYDQSRSPLGNEEENNNGSPVGNEPKQRTMDIAGEDYGIGRMSVARLLRINELCDELKKLVDTGNIKIRPAVELSYIPKDAQKRLYERMSAMGVNGIDMKTAKELRQTYKAYKEFTDEHLEQILNFINEGVKEEKPHKIALTADVFNKYLSNVSKKDVVSIVEKALEMYFKREMV